MKKGFIKPFTLPAGYLLLFIRKKNGKLRLYINYRQLNVITIKNRYLLPVISELQIRIIGTKVFTKIDIRKVYYRIRIKSGEEWKTAFRTRFGYYKYIVMPFGLTNIPATIQVLINDTLKEYLDRFCVVYLNDILIYSDSVEDYKKYVRLVLKVF